MNGLLLIDKPPGITSFDVVRKVRRWCATRQVGHCGTLDPAASGVLPVAVGSATRLVEYLLAGDKEYLATLKLGVVTDTQDGEGEVLATSPLTGIDREYLAAVAAGFRGAIEQVPPMYSALKRDGVPLYKLARQGLEVERQARAVHIAALDILAVELPAVTLRIVCSKGTYVRTLCHDLGQQLGCGGHMATLRRTRCGTFAIDQCAGVDQLDALAAAGQPLPLLPPAAALPDWPGLQLTAAARARLANGISPGLEELSTPAELTIGQPVRLLAGEELGAVGCYRPAVGGGRGGAFELWKVFPEALSAVEKLYSAG
jgi:tRNA pseudouridine55 synthase